VDLLGWLQLNFERYGDIYSASIYGSSVYVINTPQMAEHVLLRNWRNYLRKGQAVKRIAFSLGPGLISANGERWASQRRMIQPAFTRAAVNALFEAMRAPNQALLGRWQQAAAADQSVDVTHDLSLTVLEVTLRAIFGSDYETVAPDFRIIAEETRNLEFAHVCSALGSVIVGIVDARRARQSDAADILGRMMAARDRQGLPMPDAQLAREVLTLVIAGHETTASVLNWVWYLLTKHEEVQARVAQEVRQAKGKAGLSLHARAAALHRQCPGGGAARLSAAVAHDPQDHQARPAGRLPGSQRHRDLHLPLPAATSSAPVAGSAAL
jgi:cytochrome P450